MRTIASKLTRIYMTVAISVICITGMLSLLYIYHHARLITHDNLKTQAAALAGNLESAVAFGDANFAEQSLNALKHYPAVRLAMVILPDKHVLAKYVSDGAENNDDILAHRLASGDFMQFNKHGVTQTIVREGEAPAYLILVASLEDLNRDILLIFLTSVAIGSLILFTTYMLFRRMSREVTRPIEDLTTIVRTIEHTGDYHQSTMIESDDETGELAIALDNMRRSIVLYYDEIRQRTEELLANQAKLTHAERQNAVIEATTRAKDLFLANISHEIRTPMNAIIGLTDLALKQDIQPKVRDYLTKVRAASLSLLRIINDVLDFSKVESGKLVLERAPFHLGDLFDHLSDMLRNQSAEKNIELIMEIEKDCPVALFGDVLRLEQILLNLTSNALKFTEQGVVHVLAWNMSEGVSPDNTKNSGPTSDDESSEIVLGFSVRDSGVGLSPEQIEKLFRPFVQADDSTTRRYGGTGLGLSICKRLVELMGGKIGVESSIGAGSVFHFTIVCNTSPDLDRAAPLPPEPLQGLEVLVADDNETARDILGAMLSRFSLNPTLVASGHEALTAMEGALAKGAPYPLVCLDYRMPGINGIETAWRIQEIVARAAGKGAPPRIILLTAFSREELLATEASLAGISAFLSKPINSSLLFDTVMELFGQQVTTRTLRGENDPDYTEIIDAIGGSHILLVDDIPINQQVASELLAGVGILVDLANNGTEAVQKVGQNHYDAVLMDIQMPIMDGYDAARAIRRDARFTQLPIIAMTAHAMSSDRDKALAAGMNDHLSKPIDPDRLFSLLLTHIKHGARAPVDKALLLEQRYNSGLEMAEENARPCIDMKSALARVMGNRELLEKLLADFKREYANVAIEVRGFLVKNEAEHARQLTHKIKGIAGNIGACTVFTTARALELAIEQGTQSEVPSKLKAFADALQNTLIAIGEKQPIADTTDPAPESPPLEITDVEAMKPALRELSLHLANFCADALSVFHDIEPLLNRSGLAQEVAQMAEEIDQFQFSEAEVSLGSILKKLGISL